MIGAAFALQSAWKWQGVTIDALVNGGTALVLAGVLFWFQRRFTGTVAQRVVSAAVGAFGQEIDDRIAPVSVRLDNLESETRRLLQEDSARQTAIIEGMSAATFTSVASAMAEMNAVTGSQNSGITVPASDDRDSMFVEFAWEITAQPGAQGVPTPQLRLEVTPRHLPAAVLQMPRVEAIWDPEQSVDELSVQLVQALRQSNIWNEDRFSLASALGNLQRAIRTVIESRAGTGPPLLGVPLEMIGEWVLTEAGLEHTVRGLVLAHSEFPERPRWSGKPRDETWTTPAPEGVTKEEWEVVIERGKRRFPFHQGPVAVQSRWPSDQKPHATEK